VRQVPIRELNQHTAEVLARVEMGERLEITRNGVRVAVLEPAEPDPLGVLIEAGELRIARGRLPLFPTPDEPDGDAADPDADSVDTAGLDAVLEDRYSDGRW
jgi:prevent-host-death family protein